MNSSCEAESRKRPNTATPQPEPKRLRNCDYTTTIPEEILVYIFSYLSTKDLYRSIRCVCKRWYVVSSASTLWKRITAESEVPSNVLCNWLENSPLLKELVLKEREDVDVVTKKVATFCKNLRSIKIENSKGTVKSKAIKSANLCGLLTKCKFLNNIYFSGVAIRSCKFFKLLSRRKSMGISRKCSYYGPISHRQMIALIEAIVSSEVYEAATLLTSNNRKISLRDYSVLKQDNSINVSDTVNSILEDITNEMAEQLEAFDDDYVPTEDV